MDFSTETTIMSAGVLTYSALLTSICSARPMTSDHCDRHLISGRCRPRDRSVAWWMVTPD
jgi:hypothetical protein